TIDVTEENMEVIYEKTALVKFQSWKYEKEFRLLSREPNNQKMLPVKNKKLVFPPEMLIGVILGSQISNSDRQLIEKLCKGRPDGFLKKAVLNDDKYELSILDL
ncbi:MAG: hypothetical protein LJE56_03905, partial [Acidiferrobacterales bacterium]|nr:hypothetical protein [Acidiferrobacterales bacterium]